MNRKNNRFSKLTRRDFIRRGAVGLAGLAAPMFIPASALGREGRPAPSERVTVASIGVGGQGKYDTEALFRLPDVQLVAVCDVDKRHLEEGKALVEKYYSQQRAGGQYRGCDTYSDFREVLAREDIDAVMIATPDHWHAVISVAAAQAGKDIYCEKPLANSIPEGRAVVNAVKRYGRILQTGSHERSRDNARFACELVRNGRIGKLHTVRVNMPVDNHGPIPPQPVMPVPPELDYDFWLGPAPWEPYTEKRVHFWFRYILDYSGGEITDRGAHILDLAQLGMGTDDTGPISVSGEGWFPPEGLFNTAMSYRFELEYANGVRVIGESKGPRGIKFEGDKGWIFIYIHGGDLRAEPASLLREVLLPGELHLGRSRGHHANFIEAVKTRGHVMAPAEVGHRTASICHLINVAMRLKRPLKWDPVREVVQGDDEANHMLLRSMRSPWRV